MMYYKAFVFSVGRFHLSLHIEIKCFLITFGTVTNFNVHMNLFVANRHFDR